jgi:hypothetical protein
MSGNTTARHSIPEMPIPITHSATTQRWAEPGGGYIFNLSTRGLSSGKGTYETLMIVRTAALLN